MNDSRLHMYSWILSGSEASRHGLNNIFHTWVRSQSELCSGGPNDVWQFHGHWSKSPPPESNFGRGNAKKPSDDCQATTQRLELGAEGRAYMMRWPPAINENAAEYIRNNSAPNFILPS